MDSMEIICVVRHRTLLYGGILYMVDKTIEDKLRKDDPESLAQVFAGISTICDSLPTEQVVEIVRLTLDHKRKSGWSKVVETIVVSLIGNVGLWIIILVRGP